MAFLKKGYAAVHEKKAEIDNALSGNYDFPFIRLYDGSLDPDPEKPSEVLGRFLDHEPVTFEKFSLEKGSVQFIHTPGSVTDKLKEREKPGFRGVFPFLVYAADSPEVKAYLEEFDEGEEREEAEMRLFNCSSKTAKETTIHRFDFSYKWLTKIETDNRKKKIMSRDVVVSRTGAAAQDTSYAFEWRTKSEINEDYSSLELPDFEELYKEADEEEVELYLKKGAEALKRFREKKKEDRKKDRDKSKSSHNDDEDDEEDEKPKSKSKSKSKTKVEDDEDDEEDEAPRKPKSKAKAKVEDDDEEDEVPSDWD